MEKTLRGPETEKSHEKRLTNGFYEKYMPGKGLDIGYRGSIKDAEPVLDTAIGIELGYIGYDGKKLPFLECSQDFVFNSHCLEHIFSYKSIIQDWFRVLKVGGHLVIIVPHQFLYEKKKSLGSHWNGDHKRFYTAASLLREIEESLIPNAYRIVHLRDNDDDFDYNIPPGKHSSGCYEIELVIKKIEKPSWDLE